MDLFAPSAHRPQVSLTRLSPVTLQINLGPRCDQACAHCHLEAGPTRSEALNWPSLLAAAEFGRGGGFQDVDLTGGAPELHPDLERFLELVRPWARRLSLRTNLTALAGRPELLDRLVRLRVALVASLPALDPTQAERQRDRGSLALSLDMLRRLNDRGYGRPWTGLELDLAVNPLDDQLPPPQAQVESEYREGLGRLGLGFNRVLVLANAPLGRFKAWLTRTGRYDAYLARLAQAFNPAAARGVMCRTLVAVGWDGRLYDCDFHLAAGLPLGRGEVQVAQAQVPPQGSPIVTADHCLACLAGAGFT